MFWTSLCLQAHQAQQEAVSYKRTFRSVKGSPNVSPPSINVAHTFFAGADPRNPIDEIANVLKLGRDHVKILTTNSNPSKLAGSPSSTMS